MVGRELPRTLTRLPWRRHTQATLKLGNTINREHKALDGAFGVAISSLLKLANTKATDGTTLLDYIVRFVAERGEVDLLHVRAELPSLEAACGLDEPKLVIEALVATIIVVVVVVVVVVVAVVIVIVVFSRVEAVHGCRHAFGGGSLSSRIDDRRSGQLKATIGSSSMPFESWTV